MFHEPYVIIALFASMFVHLNFHKLHFFSSDILFLIIQF
jgi:hypothetical protein